MAAEDYIPLEYWDETERENDPEPSDYRNILYDEYERRYGKMTKKRVPLRKTLSHQPGMLAKTLRELEPKIRKQIEASVKKELQFASHFGLTPDEPPFEWKMADGRKIHPRQMEESHLRNSISYTQRRLVAALGNTTWLADTAWLARAFYEFLKEAKRRGIRV